MYQERGEVLIVDDDVGVRETLQGVMEHAGYVATAAADGQEALECVAHQEFDVVLLDVNMPGMSGLEVLRDLHRDCPDTSIIMVTAADDVRTVIDAMKSGAYDYIIKPPNLDDLVVKVGRARERRTLVIQNRRYQHHLEEMVEEQRARLQNQFTELIQSLTREHALLYELESERAPRGRKPLETLPPPLRKPTASVQEFAGALLRIIQEGRLPR